MLDLLARNFDHSVASHCAIQDIASTQFLSYDFLVTLDRFVKLNRLVKFGIERRARFGIDFF